MNVADRPADMLVNGQAMDFDQPFIDVEVAQIGINDGQTKMGSMEEAFNNAERELEEIIAGGWACRHW
jgi:hypothetical protein